MAGMNGNNYEKTMEQEDKSYFERLGEISSKIDDVLSFIYERTNTLRGEDPQAFNTFQGEYEKLISYYEPLRNEATILQGQGAPDAVAENTLIGLKQILAQAMSLANAMGAGAQSGTSEIPMDEDIGDGSAFAMRPRGMGQVDQDGNILDPGSETIVMEEAGPIREWWDGLSDSTRLLFKAVGVGVAIFAGKKVFSAITKKWQEMKVDEMTEEVLDDDDDRGLDEEDELGDELGDELDMG